MFAVVWYTILSVALNSVATGGGSNLMTDEDIANLTPKTHAERERGSKWVFVSEHAFILCIWSLKACMLVIYSRITEGLKQRKWINYIAIYVAIGFVATELSLFLICRPITNYWAVPPPDGKNSGLVLAEPQLNSLLEYQINVRPINTMRSSKGLSLSQPTCSCCSSPFPCCYKSAFP
jgi:hypothetical protein